MPNNMVKAAVEGLPNMNRRRFLAGAPVATAALTIPAAVAIADEDDPRTDPHDRLKFHIEGLKQAMQEIDPTCEVWFQAPAPNDTVIRFMLTGSRKAGA